MWGSNLVSEIPGRILRLTVTDLRPTVAVFLGFDGLDYDADPGAATCLDTLISRSQRVLQQHGGVLLELIIGDKGSYLYGSFGAAQAHEDDARRAVGATLAAKTGAIVADVASRASSRAETRRMKIFPGWKIKRG